MNEGKKIANWKLRITNEERGTRGAESGTVKPRNSILSHALWIVLCFVIILIPGRLSAEPGVVIGYPHSILLDRPFGRELETLVWKTAVDILDQERFFSRIAVEGRTGWLPNAQLMTDSWFRQHQSRFSEPGAMVRIAVPREIPLYAPEGNAILRMIPPAWILPVLAEEAHRFRVRFLDQQGWVLATDVERLEAEGEGRQTRLAPARVEQESIPFQAVAADGPVLDFFRGVTRWASVPAPTGEVEEKLRHTDEDLTLSDLRDLARQLGVEARISEGPARLDRLDAGLTRGELIVVKLRVDREERYLLVRSHDGEFVKLLDIFRLRGVQLRFRDFLRLHHRRPRVLIFVRG